MDVKNVTSFSVKDYSSQLDSQGLNSSSFQTKGNILIMT